MAVKRSALPKWAECGERPYHFPGLAVLFGFPFHSVMSIKISYYYSCLWVLSVELNPFNLYFYGKAIENSYSQNKTANHDRWERNFQLHNRRLDLF